MKMGVLVYEAAPGLIFVAMANWTAYWVVNAPGISSVNTTQATHLPIYEYGGCRPSSRTALP